jgi:hypothetical protein
MNGKADATRALAAKRTGARAVFDFRGVQGEAVKLPPPQLGGVKEYNPKQQQQQHSSLPPPPTLNYYEPDEPVRNATMLEHGSPLLGSTNTKFCILFLILAVVILAALTITVLVVGRHPSHSNGRPGAMAQAGFIASGQNELVYDIVSGVAKRREMIRYNYEFVLGDDVQQWQAYPTDEPQIPLVNASLYKMTSFDVCCFSDQSEWICSNGHTFDPYAFEARLKSVSESIGGVQCLIYINSRHLARSQCTLEIRMRS